jgi:hypothetical protein
MDQRVLPGDFILEAAALGRKTAAALSSFSSSVKVSNVASKISLSATLLSEIGKEVNRNEACFKANFQKTFEHVPMKCEKEYDTLLNALDKATSWRKDEIVGTEDPPKKPWKRILFALGMDESELEEFGESLEESWLRALMLQQIVSLIVLQIRAQK